MDSEEEEESTDEDGSNISQVSSSSSHHHEPRQQLHNISLLDNPPLPMYPQLNETRSQYEINHGQMYHQPGPIPANNQAQPSGIENRSIVNQPGWTAPLHQQREQITRMTKRSSQQPINQAIMQEQSNQNYLDMSHGFQQNIGQMRHHNMATNRYQSASMPDFEDGHMCETMQSPLRYEQLNQSPFVLFPGGGHMYGAMQNQQQYGQPNQSMMETQASLRPNPYPNVMLSPYMRNIRPMNQGFSPATFSFSPHAHYAPSEHYAMVPVINFGGGNPERPMPGSSQPWQKMPGLPYHQGETPFHQYDQPSSCKDKKRKSNAAQGSPMRKQERTSSGNQEAANAGSTENICAQIFNKGGQVSVSNTKCHTYIGTPDRAKESLRMDSPEAEDAVGQFIQLCNEASLKKTEDKVTSTFKHLNTPRKQVNPGFQWVDFYKGDTSLAADEYIPDELYVNHTKRVFKGKTTKFGNFFENDENYTALVADAGAGKTTAAKRFTRLVLDKKIEQLKDIKLVHFVTLAELDCDEEHNAFDLLFRPAHGLTEKMKAYGMQWVEDNSSEILLVLDGLDQTSWSLKDEAPTFPFDEPSHASKIIQNILKKHLLPHCKILLTSREHAIRNFPSNIRPQKIIALTGLSNKDRDYLIVELGGEGKGQRILDHLNQKSPGLLSLCATPVFNVFTVAIHSKDLGNAPSTMSEILIRVLVCFLNSNNRREKNIYWVFKKLKELAHHGTHQKRVLFRKDEITHLGIGVTQVNDLVIITPCELPFELPNLMEGYYRLFFCHQSVQEALTALFICERPVSEFKQFVQDHLDDPHFSVVRKIIFGVILNPKMNIPMNEEVIGAIPGKEEKIGILQDWLLMVLHHRNKNSRRDKSKQPWNIIKSKDLELYSILNECGVGATDVIEHNLQNVKFTQRQLRADSLYVLCTVLSQCKSLCKLELGEVIPCDTDICLLQNSLQQAEEIKIWAIRFDKQVDYCGLLEMLEENLTAGTSGGPVNKSTEGGTVEKRKTCQAQNSSFS